MHVPRSSAVSGNEICGRAPAPRARLLHEHARGLRSARPRRAAWRHGVDHRQLATWNNLSNPDLIFVGQRIRLTPLPTASGSASARRSPASAPRPTPSARATAPEPPVLPPPQWQWPMRGPIVSAYGDNRAIASGIGIGGSVGQAVEAAAAGRVVYTGSGLIGYGQLVIVKHNDTYLSAYGHLSRVLVAQGQDVRGGEKIAETGTGPT